MLVYGPLNLKGNLFLGLCLIDVAVTEAAVYFLSEL